MKDLRKDTRATGNARPSRVLVARPGDEGAQRRPAAALVEVLAHARRDLVRWTCLARDERRRHAARDVAPELLARDARVQVLGAKPFGGDDVASAAAADAVAVGVGYQPKAP